MAVLNHSFFIPQKMNYRANNEKSKNFVKIVNHLVALAKAIDLQRLSFLFYKKNHLVIVLMVLLCSMLICETPSHKSEKQDKIYAYRQD
jgi:hypothetical protein